MVAKGSGIQGLLYGFTPPAVVKSFGAPESCGPLLRLTDEKVDHDVKTVVHNNDGCLSSDACTASTKVGSLFANPLGSLNLT